MIRFLSHAIETSPLASACLALLAVAILIGLVFGIDLPTLDDDDEGR